MEKKNNRRASMSEKGLLYSEGGETKNERGKKEDELPINREEGLIARFREKEGEGVPEGKELSREVPGRIAF